MQRSKSQSISSRSRAFVCLAAFVLLVGFMASSNLASLAETTSQAQEARPRRSGSPTPGPTATPTPIRRTGVMPAAVSRPGNPATSAPGSSSQRTGTQAPVSRPTPTPTPRPTPVDRIAPELGAPPPPPVLKAKPSPTPEGGEEVDPDSIVKINTELVNLNVRVIDRNNHPINTVRQEDFHVFEDGVAQPIDSFSREEVPISYGLAVDTSGSLRSQLLSVIDAAKTIINSNRPGDESFLVRFISSDKIETVQDFTASKDLLTDALDNLYTEGGQTAIIDAVYLSAEHVAEYKKGDDNDRRRRALIVITDGEDRDSFYKQEQLWVKLREEDVQIFVIGFVNELDNERGLIKKSPRDKAVNLVTKLATETGGRAFFPQSLSELPEIANQIVQDLRTQYVIAYNPTNKTRDGSYRAIKVTVDQGSSSDKRIALTRGGRLAAREGGTTPKPPPVRITPPPKTATGARP